MFARGHRFTWSSKTEGHGGSSLVLHDDRNLILYLSSGDPLWASATFVGSAPAAICLGVGVGKSSTPWVAELVEGF